MVPSRSQRLILAAAGAALLLRLVFGFVYWTGKPLTHDEREYLSLGVSLARGNGFTYAHAPDGTAQQFGRAPGYPAFLALLRPPDGATETPATVKVAQSVAGAVAVLLIATITRRAAGPRAAAIAAWLTAVHPPFVWIPSYVLSEALYLPLILGCVALLCRAETISRALLAGAACGIAVLVRPGTLIFLPLAAVWLARRAALPRALLFALAVGVVVLPWTIRNMRTHGQLVLVASEGGVTFWTGNHPLARGEGDLAANPEIKRAELEFRQAHPGLTAEQLEPLYYSDALHTIRQNPGRWMVLLVKKAVYTLVPIGPSYTLHSTRYQLASVAPYAMLVPLTIAGIILLARHGRPPEYLYLLAVSVVLTSLIFFPQERFRIPVIDPFVLVTAAAALGGVSRAHR